MVVSKESDVLGADLGMRFNVCSTADAPLVPGRRDFFEFADFGVSDASNGRMRVQTISSSKGLTRPTGWHYHTCEAVVTYVLEGWANLDFEDGSSLHIDTGSVVFIPGGVKHNEVATSDNFKFLEVAVPSDMGTVACDPPGESDSVQG